MMCSDGQLPPPDGLRLCAATLISGSAQIANPNCEGPDPELEAKQADDVDRPPVFVEFFSLSKTNKIRTKLTRCMCIAGQQAFRPTFRHEMTH
mmetsp:Transcript_44175/g.94721  ORF Transcript_44175/g.94721 Transcript_44175/m.94721 type:complete len:93 (-) Transcript_44175:52-330(-)